MISSLATVSMSPSRPLRAITVPKAVDTLPFPCHIYTKHKVCPRGDECPFTHANTPVVELNSSKKSHAAEDKSRAVKVVQHGASVIRCQRRDEMIAADDPKTYNGFNKIHLAIGPRKPPTEDQRKASLLRKTWDSADCEWVSWGKANLTCDDFDRIIVPFIPELEQGIVSKEFLYTDTIKRSNTHSASFTKFPDLAYELRRQIWKFAILADSNLCRVAYKYDLQDQGPYRLKAINSKVVTLSPEPTFLRVCAESRYIAGKMRCYQRNLFATKKNPGSVIFNFLTDRLFLFIDNTRLYNRMITAMNPRDRYRVTRLAIPFIHLARSDETNKTNAILQGFPRLEELWLIAGDGIEDEVWTKTGLRWSKMQRWIKDIWAGNQPYIDEKLRATKPPTLHLEFVSAHVARFWNIDSRAELTLLGTTVH